MSASVMQEQPTRWDLPFFQPPQGQLVTVWCPNGCGQLLVPVVGPRHAVVERSRRFGRGR